MTASLFSPFFLSPGAVWDMVSQVSMLYMLLSLCMGWTLSRNRKPQSRPLQWEQSPASTAVAVGGVVTQVPLVGHLNFCEPHLLENKYPFFGLIYVKHESLNHLKALESGAMSFSGGAATVGAVLGIRERSPQLPRPAKSGGASPHCAASDAGPAAGLRSLPDHLHREEHPEERLLRLLRQSMLHTRTRFSQRVHRTAGGHVVFVSFAGVLPVVPLPPSPLPHLGHL